MNIVAIIQARNNSTRLPGKVIKKICGKTILEHILNRVDKSEYINEIVVATTDDSKDDIIEKITLNNNKKIFRGDENNVLKRYYKAAKKNNADIVIRLTADNPLVDSKIIDKGIEEYLKETKNKQVDYLRISKGYPLGLGVEVFSFYALEKAYKNAKKSYEKEHVTPYIYDANNSFKVIEYCSNEKYNEFRLTVDTYEDFKLVNEIYSSLYHLNNNFGLKEILNLLDERPELIEINRNIEQKKIK